MKTLKKLFTFVLSAFMALGMTLPAMAATTAYTDTGTITISNVDEGLTVKAYQIAKGVYDETGVGEFIGYEMTVDSTLIGMYGSEDWSDLTEAQLASLYTAASAGSAYKTATADVNGDAVFENMEIGAYLFVVTDSESTVYGLMIGSVYYATDDSGNWKIVDGEVDVESEDAWAKSTTPTVTKVETGGSLDDYEHGGSADVGDELTYQITVGPIPQYEGDYPEFKVTDVLSDNLTITEDELAGLTVKIEGTTLTKGTDYTITTDDMNGFVIDFVVDGKYTLNNYVGLNITIEYGATVTETITAEADEDDHTNDVTLNYTTNSYLVDGKEGEEKDHNDDYTYNARILKTDQDEEALAGATFTLYTDASCETEYKQNGTTMTATSGEDGYFEFTGLQEGTYYMKETTAPAGYALNTIVYQIDIVVEYNGAPDDQTSEKSHTITVTALDGSNGGAGTEIGSAVVENNANQATVENTKLGTLPSMGSTGTTMLLIAGCAVMLGAAFMYRRRATAQ